MLAMVGKGLNPAQQAWAPLQLEGYAQLETKRAQCCVLGWMRSICWTDHANWTRLEQKLRCQKSHRTDRLSGPWRADRRNLQTELAEIAASETHSLPSVLRTCRGWLKMCETLIWTCSQRNTKTRTKTGLLNRRCQKILSTPGGKISKSGKSHGTMMDVPNTWQGQVKSQFR